MLYRTSKIGTIVRPMEWGKGGLYSSGQFHRWKMNRKRPNFPASSGVLAALADIFVIYCINYMFIATETQPDV